VIAAVVLVAAAAATEPSYIVERVVTVAGEVRRTSVFRNGVAVVVHEKPGEDKRVLRQPLTEVELRLAPPGREPLVVRFPLTGVPATGAARIGQSLDGLELRMTSPGGIREDLRGWQPAVGQWLDLEDGRTGQVIEVLLNGSGFLVRVQIGTGPASIFVSDEELRRIAVRRIKK
jgi:hypothetical protein